jgi:Mg2+-importing ATPase
VLTPDPVSLTVNEAGAHNSPVPNIIQPPIGLTSDEAKLRLAKFGPNEPATAKRTATVFQLLLLFANPLAIILLAASAISAALGEVINASIIAMMALLSVALNFIQTYRSQEAVDRIRREVVHHFNTRFTTLIRSSPL